MRCRENDRSRARAGVGSAAAELPICRLAFEGNAVRATVCRAGRLVGRRSFRRLTRARVDEMIGRHRDAMADDWQPSPYTLWASETERFLADVYDAASDELIGLLRHHPRVGLRIDDPTLWSLPFETAHRPGAAAPFEVCQIFRVVDPGSGRFGRHRTFCFRYEPAVIAGLPAIGLEGVLAATIHHTGREIEDRYRRGRERLVHVAGHDPTIDEQEFSAEERAHVLLSGCHSLPRRLPAGVASATGTLWAVDDQTNPLTTTLFHGRLASGIGPLAALTQAQLLQRSFPPTVWAAYVHVGSPD